MRDKEKLRNELGSTCHPARLVKIMSSRYLSLNSPVVYFVSVLCFVLFIDYAFFNGTGLREAVECYVSSPKKMASKERLLVPGIVRRCVSLSCKFCSQTSLCEHRTTSQTLNWGENASGIFVISLFIGPQTN